MKLNVKTGEHAIVPDKSSELASPLGSACRCSGKGYTLHALPFGIPGQYRDHCNCELGKELKRKADREHYHMLHD